MELAEIFGLRPEDEKRIHPYVLQCFFDWRGEILREVPQLGQLDMNEVDADIDVYLTDDEKARGVKHWANIAEWLWKYADIGDGYSPYLYPDSALVHYHMSEFKSLLKKVYRCKVEEAQKEQREREERAKEEQTRREEEERLQDALKALNPPFQEAKIHLDSEEYRDFLQSIPDALTSVYLAHGEVYVGNHGAKRYWFWINEIKNRQEEEKRRSSAEPKAWKFNASLSNEIETLRSLLTPRKRSPEIYFKDQIGNHSYLGYRFAYLLPAGEKRSCDAIVKSKIHEMVPEEFSRFIFRRYRTYYFLLSSADYSCEAVPCLDFSFDIFAVVETEVWVKLSEKTIDGSVFAFPWIEHKCNPYGSYFAELKEPEFLGYDYRLLIPSDLGCIFWKSIPFVLIQGLMNGELEPDGTAVLEASEGSTTYEIDDFDEEVTIPEGFANYLKEVGGIDGMVRVGIASEKVANVIKKRLSQPGTDRKVPSSPTSDVTDNGGAIGFEAGEFISELTALGIPRNRAEGLLDLIPRRLALSEAIKLALKQYKETLAQNTSENI